MAAQIRVLRSAMMVFAGEGIRRDVILGCDAGNNQHCTTPYELPRKVVARLLYLPQSPPRSTFISTVLSIF